MSDRWPDEKLERQMLADAEMVAKLYGTGTEPDFAADVLCHVNAIIARVRELEDKLVAANAEREVISEQLEVAIDRSQSWKNLCEKYKDLAESRGEAIDLQRRKDGKL